MYRRCLGLLRRGRVHCGHGRSPICASSLPIFPPFVHCPGTTREGRPDDKERHMASESVQKKLERVRPPRVNISYEVETGGAIEMKELPFVMGVLGDFTGQPAEPLAKLKDRKFVEVNPDNFDDVLKSMKPHLAFTVENKLSDDAEAGKLGVDLNFESLDDFSPDAGGAAGEAAAGLLELRTKLADLRGSLQGNDKLDEILQATLGDDDKREEAAGRDRVGGRRAMAETQSRERRRPRALPSPRSACSTRSSSRDGSARTTQAQERGKDMVKRFVSEVLEGSITMARDTEAMINARIAQIDHLISLQLNEIMHAPELPEAGGARGAGSSTCSHQSETSDDAQDQGPERLEEGPAARPAAGARVRPERAVQEGVRGGVRRLRRRARSARCSATTSSARSGQDIELLEKISQVAAAAHAPFLTAAVARDVQPRELHRARRSRATSAKIFDTTEYAKWKAFRADAKIRATWRSRCRAC